MAQRPSRCRSRTASTAKLHRGQHPSNGNLSFVSNSTLFTIACPLPSATFNMPIMPQWDDLRTDQVGTGCTAYGGVGCGVFTSISGTAPNRIFNIEWSTVLLWQPIRRGANFELRLYEGQQSP